MDKLLKRSALKSFSILMSISFLFSISGENLLVKQQYKRLQNRWKSNQYIHIERGKPESSAIKTPWHSAMWQIEYVSNNIVRFKNRWKGTYLHNQNGYLQVGHIQQGWWSAMWVLEKVRGTNYVRLKNRWKNNYLHIERGRLELGGIQKAWHSAMWTLQSVTGTSNYAQQRPRNYGQTRPQNNGYQRPKPVNQTWPTAYFPSQLNGKWKYANGNSAVTIENSSTIRQAGYNYPIVKTYLKSGIHKVIARYASYYYAYYFKVLTASQAKMWKSQSYRSYAAAENARLGQLSPIYKQRTQIKTQSSSSWRKMSFPSMLNGNWYSSNGTWAYGITNSRNIRAGNVNYRVQNTYLKGNQYKIIASNNSKQYVAFHFVLDSRNSIRAWKSRAYYQFNQVYNLNASYLYPYSKKQTKNNSYSKTGRKITNGINNTAKTVGKGIYDGARAVGKGTKKAAKGVSNYFTGGKKKAGSKYITVFNQSGYVAKFVVKYSLNGKNKKWKSGSMALGAKKNFKIPVNAYNIQVKADAKSLGGWVKIFKWKSQKNKSKCYKVYGTIFSPKYNHKCK